MLNKTQFKNAFLSTQYLLVWAETKKYGAIVAEKTLVIARDTPAQMCLYYVNAMHHGMQLQFEFVNGEIKLTKASTQNNLF